MSFRFAQRSVSQVARASTRRTVASGARVSRRAASTSSTGHKQSSDTPWIIGSVAVFGPAILYLLSPSSKKDAHHNAHGHGTDKADNHSKGHTEEPVVTKDDEGNEVSEAEVKDSLKKAYSTDLPPDAEASEVSGATETPTDDEGTSITADEAKDSMAHSIVDSPKEAQSAEQKGAKFESGSPGQNEESEKDAEQKEKPNGTSGGDASSSTSAGSGSASSTVSKVPTEMGDARTQTKQGTSSGQAPGEREH